MISKTKFCMGTDITINIYDNGIDENIIEKAFDIFDKIENIFSRFKKDSELSILNNKKEKIVSDEFIKVLNLCKFFYKDTNGYFNPLVNLKTIGYSESFEKNKFYKLKENIDLNFDSIKIEGNKVILKENQKLDLGGIVKGYSVDKVANFLQKNNVKYFLIDAGGDIYGTSKNEDYFSVGVENPFNKDLLKIFKIKNKAVCTSGTYKRKWKLDKEYHHILNPKTGKNNFDIALISIVSNYATIGDVYATACIAIGKERAEKFLKEKSMIYFVF